MAKYGSDDTVIEFDSTDGGSLQDMTQYITGVGVIKKGAVVMESTTFGDTWREHLDTGLREMDDIVLDMFYDDTSSTGSWVVFNSLGSTRTFKVTYGSTKTTTVETVIVDVSRNLEIGSLHMMSVTLRPTGTVTEA